MRGHSGRIVVFSGIFLQLPRKLFKEDTHEMEGFFMLAVALHFAGCATLFKGTTQDVNFNSNPQKARVIANGVEMGETPVSLKLETKKTYTIEFQADG